MVEVEMRKTKKGIDFGDFIAPTLFESGEMKKTEVEVQSVYVCSLHIRMFMITYKYTHLLFFLLF
jgi:hypothetical protein